MSSEQTSDIDVLVLGGGLAGLSLARRLHLVAPGTRVWTLDRGSGPRRKVGESTVEIGGHFFHTRLGLKEELARTQLPKAGLRFWFDNARKDLSFAEASEDGPMTVSWWESYQLDRERLERTLLEKNRSVDPIRHLYDVTIEAIRPGKGEAPHEVRFTGEAGTQTVRAAWLVDATGFSGLTSRKEGRFEAEERIPHGAAWGWFRGASSVDDCLDETKGGLRTLCNRQLSTNHLMQDGYWIWLIPLRDGTLSVGVVYDRTVLKTPPRSEGDFLEFLREHRMAREVIDGAELFEFGQMRGFARRPSTWFDHDRRAWIGVAGGFADPFYSGGSDFIGLACDQLADLIARERSGDASWQQRLRTHNRFLRAFYEQTVRFVADLYRTFASFEISVVRYRRDLHLYWNLYVWPYLTGEFLEPDRLEAWFPLLQEAERRSAFFARLFRHLDERLRERGELRRRNRGEYAFNQLGYRLFPVLRFERGMGAPIDDERSRRLMEENDLIAFLAVLDILFDGDRSPLRGLLFDIFDRLGMERILELEADLGLTEAFWTAIFDALSRGLADEGLDLRVDARTFSELRKKVGPVRKAYLSLPRLTDCSTLPSRRDDVQPPTRWQVGDSPWPLEDLNSGTVYDFMARRGGPMAEHYVGRERIET